MFSIRFLSSLINWFKIKLLPSFILLTKSPATSSKIFHYFHLLYMFFSLFSAAKKSNKSKSRLCFLLTFITLHYTHWRKWKKSPLTTALPYSIIIILNFPHHFLLRKDLQWTMKVIKTIFSFSYNNFITLHCNILSSIQPTIKKSGNNNRERQLINTQYFVS